MCFFKNTGYNIFPLRAKRRNIGVIVRFFIFIFLFYFAVASVRAQDIMVGGTIIENQTWTNQFTYVVTEDLIVPENVVLTIQPGVVVKVNFGRGIIVNGGSLLADGSQSDTIRFVPNYDNVKLNWKWKGLTIKNSNIDNASSFQYTLIDNSETAFSIEESSNFSILNSSILNSQNVGISISNSSNVSISDCNVENNYDGIEIMVTPIGESSNNIINNCLVKNQNHNIYVFIEDGGLFQDNIFSSNIISSGNNGIWINNSGGDLQAKNTIENNFIINNGANIGYGLFLALDASVVVNNIFWKNNIAVFTDQKGDDNEFTNNNFYQNNWVFAIGAGSTGNKYFNNTFSLNTGKYINISETSNISVKNSNFLHTNGFRNIVFNNTNHDFSMPDNFWGTTDTAQINELIFDEIDNSLLGKINYEPYLPVLDTSNPISAPYQAIKQIVNDKVRISWQANPEPDLEGYGIYFGEYADYSFSNNDKLGNDTVFFFQDGVSIDDLIAVTAYDSTASGSNDQTFGHESPFAFAHIFPFAGSDTTICSDIDEFKMADVTIPFVWQTLFWTTSGDGFFNNNEEQYPIYYPGDNDSQKASVIISLNVPVGNDTLIDSFKLTIINSPKAFAGNDTIVFADSEIELSDAIAQNYSSINWFTDGDGVFSNDTIANPVYIPGFADNQGGVVKLWMSLYSQCGYAEDSITILLIPHFSIEGKLWSNQRSVNPGVVIAFNETDDGDRAVQMENTMADGSFKFERLAAGNYYLYALPDTNSTEKNAPGYYANKLHWQSAYVLPVFEDVYDVDIQLPSTVSDFPEGEASISGHMALPAVKNFNSDIYCSSWFGESAKIYCQDGFSNATVLLFNSEKTVLLEYTLTDDLGNFYFNHLPYGAYIIEAEKVGLQSVASPIINLDPEHKNESGVLLEMDYKKITAYFNQDLQPDKTLAVFPNPASSFINIPLAGSQEFSSQIKVFDLFGNIVRVYDIPAVANVEVLKCDIADLPSGVYFGQIENVSKTVFFKFMKL